MLSKIDMFVKIYLVLAAIVVVFTVLSVGYFTQPDYFVRNYAPEQPVPFSHGMHAGTMKVPCLYCHTGASVSRFAGIPPTEKCMNCHKYAKTESPYIIKVRRSFETGEPLEWKRVHFLPDHVYFDHRPHVNAGVACQTCHGEIQNMPVVTQKMSMRMASCLGCHREPGAALPIDSPVKRGPEDCKACHR